MSAYYIGISIFIILFWAVFFWSFCVIMKNSDKKCKEFFKKENK